MMTRQDGENTVDKKALQINLDATKYGTFAEIGAGQEVARQFFHVGGASGTIAKTISAYDMTFSDAIYGPCPRYVSRQRLYQMLEYEYNLLIERLADKRAGRTSFFAFANTVAASAYNHPAESHGWMGIRFQAHPRAEPNQIIIHVRMLDKENIQQQEALGIIGVNLIHSAFYLYQNPENFIGALLDGLTIERIQVDIIKFTGPDFHYVDNRLMALQLVEQGLSDAAMFTADGEVVRADELLYKKAVLVERGSFRPLTNTTQDILDSAKARFLAGAEGRGRGNRRAHGDHDAEPRRLGRSQRQDRPHGFPGTRRRARQAGPHGAHLQVRRILPAGRVPVALHEEDDRHRHGHPVADRPLPGKILHQPRRRHPRIARPPVQERPQALRLPRPDEKTGELLTVQNLKVAPNLQNLYDHLVENHFIEGLEGYNPENLSIFSRAVLKMIQSGEPGWEKMVPQIVADMIKQGRLYGYQPTPAER